MIGMQVVFHPLAHGVAHHALFLTEERVCVEIIYALKSGHAGERPAAEHQTGPAAVTAPRRQVRCPARAALDLDLQLREQRRGGEQKQHECDVLHGPAGSRLAVRAGTTKQAEGGTLSHAGTPGKQAARPLQESTLGVTCNDGRCYANGRPYNA
jgi:hypothetical protein